MRDAQFFVQSGHRGLGGGGDDVDVLSDERDTEAKEIIIHCFYRAAEGNGRTDQSKQKEKQKKTPRVPDRRRNRQTDMGKDTQTNRQPDGEDNTPASLLSTPQIIY